MRAVGTASRRLLPMPTRELIIVGPLVWLVVSRLWVPVVAAPGPDGPLSRVESLLSSIPNDAPIAERVVHLSTAFLGVPYVLDPAGEGPDGSVDRDPQMPLDRMDCQTFVETVLALARARRADAVWDELRAIRYRDGEVSFERRHHFPEVDWLPANLARGVLRAISADVAGEYGAALASASITRPTWLRLLPHNPTQARNDYLRWSSVARSHLEQLASVATTETGTIRFVAKQALANAEVIARIPEGAILLVVRPRSSMFGRVGSVQNVSHMGFAVRTAAGLVYRHASATRRRAVIDRSLSEYLEAMGKTKTFAGMAVYAVQPRE